MTSQYTLSGTKRENFGKRASKRYRVDNMVPAVIYGASKENQSILVNSFELNNQIKDPQFYSNVIDLNVDKTKIEVILKDLQRDPQKSFITHIDFLVIDQKVKIHVNVPFKFINEDTCHGVKVDGGKISHIITEIEINCLPKDIPENIVVDIAKLEINQSIHLTEITFPEGVELLAGGDKDHDTAIVKCYKPVEEVIEDTAPEAIGEPEVTSESKEASPDDEKEGEDVKKENSDSKKE
ncbi:MAG: 50S ribosomal protein L25 [Gammaproteobacteria bacterium]|nr:MAG: 50S ribosomal protein L25/general stress protein Ctc [Gammaproteobacteria bacterium TMED257]CAI8333404.1 MAG: 50S ribosomal protein L25 [Gammaproteobacteria bacterium]|tara:strand:+ start:1008 stop:1721 length:714 start_codon:yes stop_codon:yes gene_type:complete